MNDEPLLTWKGRRVRSPDDGPEGAARKVPLALLKPGSLFFVPSPLEGWGLDALLEKLPADGALVVLEIDPDLRQHCRGAFEKFLGTRTGDPRLFWLEADTEESISDLFGRLPLGQLRRSEFLTFNGAWMIHAQRYRQVFSRLEQGLIRWWSNRITSVQMGPLWVRNFFDNLRSPTFSFSPWPDWGDSSVVVCGAGVTLETALPWIRAHRDHWKVIAVDTALPIFKAWSMIPDAVVCLEAQHANLQDFSGWLGARVPLFADLTSFPPATRVFNGSLFWYISEFAPLALWERWPWDASLVPRIPPLGSVGVVAAWIAWKLTRGQVLLAGLDFSFPDGQSHARGAPSLSALGCRTDRLHPMEQTGTWEGAGRYRTRANWLTTNIMDGYAGVLSEQAAVQASRTRTWKEAGIPLGLRLWSDRRTHESTLAPTTGLATGSADNPTDAKAWLQHEKNLWNSLLRRFDELNAFPQDDSIWEKLEEQLRDVDYLTFSFPDPEIRRASDWLIRALSQIHWIVDRTG